MRARTRELLQTQSPAIAARARRNLELLALCPDRCPDVEQFMVAAVNYRLLERHEEAIRTYERALEFDRRPEIYLQLGLTQLRAGQRKAAIENLVTASRFNIYYALDISDPAVRDEVLAAVKRIDPSPFL